MASPRSPPPLPPRPLIRPCDPPIAVVGGGIAGLAVAVALQDAGLPVAVFERDPQFEGRKQGYGLTLQACSALDALGVLAGVRGCDTASTEHWTFAPSGRVLGYYGNALGRRAGDAAAHATRERGNIRIPRERLRRLLLARLAPGTVRWGARLARIVEGSRCAAGGGGGGVTLHFSAPRVCGGEEAAGEPGDLLVPGRDTAAGGDVADVGVAGGGAAAAGPPSHAPFHASAVVGADGIHSVVRRHMAGLVAAPTPTAGHAAVGGPSGEGVEGRQRLLGAVAGLTVGPATADAGTPAGSPPAPTSASGGLSYLGVVLVLGVSRHTHPLLSRAGFYTLDGAHRLFTMPFAEEGDGTLEETEADKGVTRSVAGAGGEPRRTRLTMWQFSFAEPSLDAARRATAGGPASLLAEVRARTIGWHAPVAGLLDDTLEGETWGTPLYDYGQPRETAALPPNVWVAATQPTPAEPGSVEVGVAAADGPAAQPPRPSRLRPPVPHDLDKGRFHPCITLAGDAAHPMSPYKGQGANQALRDGPTLAEWLARKRCASVPAALNGYEREMAARAGEKVIASRHAAAHLHSPAVLDDPPSVAGVPPELVRLVLDGAAAAGVGAADGHALRQRFVAVVEAVMRAEGGARSPTEGLEDALKAGEVGAPAVADGGAA